jgi:acylphosphatase
MLRLTSHFSGRVQGVGFRYTAHNIARRYPISGYVQNLPDGRVKLVLEGEKTDIDAVVRAIGEHLDAHVKNRTDEQSPATGEFGGFEIRY